MFILIGISEGNGDGVGKGRERKHLLRNGTRAYPDGTQFLQRLTHKHLQRQGQLALPTAITHEP
jgi:hypothetical protein